MTEFLHADFPILIRQHSYFIPKPWASDFQGSFSPGRKLGAYGLGHCRMGVHRLVEQRGPDLIVGWGLR
jgi:hypothetical protein